MKFKKMFALALILFITGCSQNSQYTFEGESENWKVVYDVMQQSNSDQNIEFNIAYVGNGESPSKIDYNFSTLGNEYSAERYSANKETKTFKGSALCKSCISVVEDSFVNFTVNWDGKTEDITLEQK